MALPGSVVYVGSISFENNSGNLSFKITEDLDKAREFTKNEYPSLAEHIVLEKPSIKKIANVSCTTTIYIPVSY